MPTTLLLIFVAMALSALVLPAAVGQMRATRTATDRGQALHEAEAGIQAAVAHLRAAQSDGTGQIKDLPCGADIRDSRTVGTAARYTVNVSYYRSDPAGRIASEVAALLLDCTKFATDPTKTPAVARLVSTGVGNGGTARTLEATYTFRTTFVNVAGGRLKTASGGRELCLDAGSASPVAGTQVRLEACSPQNAVTAQQRFAYNKNLTISLPSALPAYPTGLCLDAGPLPVPDGAAVRVQSCATSGAGLTRQQWGFDDYAQFRATLDGLDANGLCLSGSRSAGTPITVGENRCLEIAPDATAGAGQAGEELGQGERQVVNYLQFSRCLDVPDQTTEWGFLIVWPCKQAPDRDRVAWNQRFLVPEPAWGQVSQTGTIRIREGSTVWCLESPRSSVVGQYVRPTTCGPDPEQRWTRNARTDQHETSYTIVDSAGYCLALTDPDANPADLFNSRGFKFSKVVVARCDGSSGQKWNADPYALAARPLKDFEEN